MAKEPEYHLTVFMSEDRKNKQKFFTLKSARHYAKTVCNNDNVQRIVLTGRDVQPTTLFSAEAHV